MERKESDRKESNRPHAATDVFLDSEQVEQERAERVGHYAFVTWSTWAVMSAFMWIRGYHNSSLLIGITELILIPILVAFCRRHQGRNRNRLIMNSYLGSTAVGLFLVAMSDPALAGTLVFYPIGILVSAHLIGVRGAVPWLLVNFFACCLYSVVRYGFHDTWYTAEFDKLVLTFGVGFCTFFCCYQSESLFRKRSGDLVALSYGLQQKTEELHLLATTDSLTGLMNRHHFQSELARQIQTAKSESSRVGLILIDMDGFKEINDTLGHVIGDDALIEVANRLRQLIGDASIVSRLGGDEFCVIQPEVTDPEETRALAESVRQCLCKRYLLDSAEFPLGASVGIAFFPDDASSERELLAYADTAMYHAKENDHGASRYESSMTDRLVAYREMQDKLAVALERDEFFLVYQPQTDIRTGKVVGVEALLRWRCDGEIVSPAEFVPLLEKSCLIISVGRWLIREACFQLRKWNDAGYQIRMSVNVSAVQFHDLGFTTSVEDAIEEFGVDPSDLDFEVTEGFLIKDMEDAVKRLEQLKELGCTVSIDDFGTGYSSLAYLQRLPIDKLKIDRAFVKDIPHGDDGAIAKSIIVLAQTLGLRTIAEGVETVAQLEFLKDTDCHEFQGYYQSRPVLPDEVVEHFDAPQSQMARRHVKALAPL